QLSMDYSRPPAEHFAIGQQLGVLRERGVLIVGSGNIVHNLRTMRRDAADNQAYDWVIEFDRITAGHIEQGRLEALCDFQQLGDMAQLAHPSWEHYLPLLYTAGAVEAGERPRFFNEGFQAASISMRSVIWGENLRPGDLSPCFNLVIRPHCYQLCLLRASCSSAG
ncbi:Extradiol ring-cleavage dioxygenase, class III enzyme, subunit B, partial [sediment metagenome]